MAYIVMALYSYGLCSYASGVTIPSVVEATDGVLPSKASLTDRSYVGLFALGAADDAKPLTWELVCQGKWADVAAAGRSVEMVVPPPGYNGGWEACEWQAGKFELRYMVHVSVGKYKCTGRSRAVALKPTP